MEKRIINHYKKIMFLHETVLILNTIHNIEIEKIKELAIENPHGEVLKIDLTKKPFDRSQNIRLSMQYLYRKFNEGTLNLTDISMCFNHSIETQNEQIGLYTEEFWDRMDKGGYGHLRKQNWLIDIFTKNSSIIERKNRTLIQGISSLKGAKIYEKKYSKAHRNKVDDYLNLLIEETLNNLNQIAKQWNGSEKNKKSFLKYYERILSNPKLFMIERNKKDQWNNIFESNFPISVLKFYENTKIP